MGSCSRRQSDKSGMDRFCKGESHDDAQAQAERMLAPVNISIAVHRGASPSNFLQEATVTYLLSSFADRPGAYWHHHACGQMKHKGLPRFLNAQQHDVSYMRLEALAGNLLLALSDLVGAVCVGPFDVEHRRESPVHFHAACCCFLEYIYIYTHKYTYIHTYTLYLYITSVPCRK